MRSVTQLKSLGDLRTTISTHARSTPRNKGSSYLEIYLLDTERQRLETELDMLAKRQRRIEGRLGEIQVAKEKMLSRGQQKVADDTGPLGSTAGENRTPESCNSNSGKWRKMTIEY